MVAQIRGFAFAADRPAPPYDAVIAFDVIPARDAFLPLEAALVDEVGDLGANVTVVEGGSETAGLEFGWVRQARYLEAAADKRFAVVWLSPTYRAGFADQGGSAATESMMLDALGIPSREASLRAVLEASRLAPTDDLPAPLLDAIGAYQRRGDAVALYEAQAAYPRFALSRIFDPESRQSFLVIADAEGRVRGVANVSPIDAASRVELEPSGSNTQSLERFVETRAGWLVIGRSAR